MRMRKRQRKKHEIKNVEQKKPNPITIRNTEGLRYVQCVWMKEGNILCIYVYQYTFFTRYIQLI